MALRCSDRIAIENGRAWTAPEMLMWLRANPGWRAISAKALIPPIEFPITQASRAKPSARTTQAPASAMSSTERSGKLNR